MQKITPFLWFNGQAEEAARFYTTLFRDGKLGAISRYGKGAPMPEGTAMVVSFELFGQAFLAMNGGPQYQFSPAISYVVNCENQEEIDHYWEQLSEGGTTQRCGWLQDRYGMSWQIVPHNMGTLMSHPDKERTERVMQAMFQMKKLDMRVLEDAFNGATASVA
jgi:predicted 3-demethylubiquinone-9 3-methyltransferase (glyoxalase superfamily)